MNNDKNSHSSWTDAVLIKKALGPFTTSEPLAQWHSVTFENIRILKNICSWNWSHLFLSFCGV